MPSISNNLPAHPEASPEQLRDLTVRFACIFNQAYLEASDEVRGVIMAMVRVVSDPTTDPEDRESCLETLGEALFPTRHMGELGVDLEGVKTRPTDGSDADAIQREMVVQEDSFAQRLEHAMSSVGMTQTRLAELTGVGQPAIAMMLSRHCRPQRRTIQKVADALGLPPEELWPGYSA